MLHQNENFLPAETEAQQNIWRTLPSIRVLMRLPFLPLRIFRVVSQLKIRKSGSFRYENAKHCNWTWRSTKCTSECFLCDKSTCMQQHHLSQERCLCLFASTCNYVHP